MTEHISMFSAKLSLGKPSIRTEVTRYCVVLIYLDKFLTKYFNMYLRQDEADYVHVKSRGTQWPL